MKTFSTFVIAVALIVGMVGCGEVTPATSYGLTMAVAPSGGGTVTDLTDASPYAGGTSVSIEAASNPGYRFVNWTAPAGAFGSATAAATTFTMPAQNVSVTANFVRVYDLTMAVSPAGQGTVTDLTGGSPYAEGTSVSVMAVANSGYHFANWTAPAGTFGNATAAQTTFVMPAQNVGVTANFAVDLYFQADVCVALNGPASLPPEERNPCVILEVVTNIVMDSVRVDLPDGGSTVIPRYPEFSPGVEGTAVLHFFTCAPGVAVAGGEYIFTGLDAAGEPLPGARSTDIWVGVEPPDPPTNVRAELTGSGILVSWDESPIIPGSFEPRAEPQLGFYQLMISRIETGEDVYGANGIIGSPHLVPRDKGAFIKWKDFGLSLSEMEDGTYRLYARIFGVAPEGSPGKGAEYNNSDPNQDMGFTIQDGEITIE